MGSKSTNALRAELDAAVLKRRLPKALDLLVELEKLEPDEPRWPRRRGDVLRQLDRPGEAVAAWERAVDLYVRLGFVAKAVAMAKTISSVDPNRTDVLARVKPPSRPPPSRKSRFSLPPAARGDRNDDAPIGVEAALEAASPLERAWDADVDEIRFEDCEVVEIDLSEPEVSERSVPPAGPDEKPPSAEHLALLPLFPLFAEVDPDGLRTLAEGSDLVERTDDGGVVLRGGEPADSLWAIVEGTVRVEVPGATSDRPVLLSEGDVFGESCLLEGGRRRADVFVFGSVSALRIPRDVLVGLVEREPGVGELLFELLARRLLGNLLTTSPLFAAFDPPTRRELARLFEVRRARGGTLLLEAGKRSDGLYLVLAGRIAVERGGAPPGEAGPGAWVGQRSLLTHGPSPFSVRAVRDLVVLRLAASRFNVLASQFPSVLAHLSELATQELEPLVPEALS